MYKFIHDMKNLLKRSRPTKHSCFTINDDEITYLMINVTVYGEIAVFVGRVLFDKLLVL